MIESVDLFCDEPFHARPWKLGSFMRDFETPNERIRVYYDGKRNTDGTFKSQRSVRIDRQDRESGERFAFDCTCGSHPEWKHDTLFPVIDKLMRADVSSIHRASSPKISLACI